MSFIGIIIIILLVYFLIIRPLTKRNRPQVYQSRRDYYEPRRDYYDPRGHYGSGPGGFGGMGSFAGGIAAGALLTYLFNQGRIGFDQFHALQQLQDHEIMRELMDQNIIQEHEIDQLQEELGQGRGDDPSDWDEDGQDVQFDRDDQNNPQDNNDFGNWDNGDDNWV
ncbi:hypothetical protein ABES02_05270 [Neobacillus pocheonensis]|uniref:hypothetical protein n=1 Tax=Neobacillus pocheonensis TaxID=363869 RepID=UPI003D28C7CF